MANVNLTESVIQQIMEGKTPREAIDMALDEKAGYHKEKRIRDGKAEVVQVKNKKRKVHHALTAGQKKAIKKAHSAAANKKRAKSIKKGAKMGLYKDSVELNADVAVAESQEMEAQVQEVNAVSEAEEEAAGVVIPCPDCANANLEVIDGEEEDDLILVCPECGKTYVICDTEEIEDDDDDDDKDGAPAEEVPAEEAPAEESVEVEAQAAEAVAEEAPVQEEECGDPENCDGQECNEPECGDGENCGEPENEETGLFFEAE